MAAEDWIPDFYHYPYYDLDLPQVEDYIELSDKEIFQKTSHTRTKKLKSIRNFYKEKGFLSPKQKYCLAFWLAENESKYV